ncbi:MAG: aryldialkylphosphatase [Rhodospirillaceae bacterium]|jgi:phosphotriesterase-related protein|nr:aryldialkylphosphatase [Rhodospirillaceae bacterium]MBT3494126.1 aryldialkylphosphatase [Rhodospirillaceae bacterium]MBT3779312.1 aryldialkylphosphatase [Rhodospirillaceae bacterium]MBT3975389.1 aryldialkylphosphatase [Rhodospirillaceae bacterium]MBT4167594.1 aryldialkylphosphatase [Rhodospirillaceae bacterium]
MAGLNRSDLKGKAQTVLGVIDPDLLGQTLMHEHLLWDIRTPAMQANPDQGPEISLCNCWQMNYGSLKVPNNYVFFDRDIAIAEVERMRTAGGETIVELSTGGLKPDPDGLMEIARATGTHVVMGCGHYVDEYQDPANRDRDIDDFAAEMVAQVYEGAWGSEARAGIIGEIGCQSPWTALEQRVMAGALIAQQETGAALNIHPGRDADQPQEVADFIAARGGDTARLIISHVDRTVFDDERLFRLADSGCVIELDLFGQEQSFYGLNLGIDLPNDADRLHWIRRLIDRGHLDQVVISHDICYRSRLSCFGGHGYGHIFDNVIPLMRRRGFSEAEVNRIIVETPRRLLTFV